MPRISIVRAIPWTLLIVTQSRAENVTELWVARYDGPGPAYYDGARAMALDRDGNVYATGLSADETRNGTDGYDFATVKYDKRGVQLWAARYNGQADLWDEPTGIAVDRAGNAYVTGRSTGVGSGFDYLTVKYDPQGNELWVARFDGGQNLNDWPRAIALDAHENVIVTGGINAADDSIRRGFATIKYTSDGQQRWVKLYGTNAKGEALAMAVDAEGSVFVTGRYDDGQQGNGHTLTIKHDAQGNVVWASHYDSGNNDSPVGIELDSLGNVVVAEGAEACRTIKYNPAGEQLWAAQYSGYGGCSAVGIALARDDSIIVTGSLGNRGFGTVKYAPDGVQLWDAAFLYTTGAAQAVAIDVDDTGNAYVVGWVTSAETGLDYMTVSYDAQGRQRWTGRYDNPKPGEVNNDYPTEIAIFGSDLIVVTGQSDGDDETQGNYPDFATVAYFQFTGSCIGNERLRADCMKRCRTGAFEIAGTIKSQLPAGTPITFTLDGAEPKTETIRPNGKARTKWKGVAEGSHVIRVEECGIEKTTDCCLP